MNFSILIISSSLYSYSLFLSFSAACLLLLRGALAWGFCCSLVFFALSAFGLSLFQLMENRFELDVL